MPETRVRFPDGQVRVVSASQARRLVECGEAARVLERDVPVERAVVHDPDPTPRNGEPRS